MARFIPPHPRKGSPEAYAWAERMRRARKKAKHRPVRPGEGRFPMSSLYAGKKTQSRRMQRNIKRVCAWCKTPMGEIPPRSDTSETHGICERCLKEQFPETARKKEKKNPLAVYSLGNPPKRVSAKIEGVIYNRCLEVRAEKTGSFEPGLYRHPFNPKSHVQVLAVDNGDILLHSTNGTKLWRPA